MIDSTTRGREMKIREKSRFLEIIGSYDVVIIGGGIAGVAAAIAASRNNTTVCIVEKNCEPGGLATLGNVNVYLPLCDGKGNKVIGGIAEQLLKLSVSDGYSNIPDCWKENGNIDERKKHRYLVEFNPSSFALAIEQCLINEGVKIMYDTRFRDVIKKNHSITHIIIESKQGRNVIECKTIIDASGDADVCKAAEENIVSVKTNVPCGWFFYFDGKKIRKSQFSCRYDPYNNTVVDRGKGFSVETIEDITEQIIVSRNHIRKIIEQLKKTNPSVYPVSIPVIPAFRMTRRLKGKIELEEAHQGIMFDDSVGMTGDWRKPGPVYYIPFSCLIAVKTKNLITAGRCISSNTAWDITRAIPVCALTGEIAGTASALFCKEKAKNFSSLDIKKLQNLLKKQSVIIDKIPGKT